MGCFVILLVGQFYLTFQIHLDSWCTLRNWLVLLSLMSDDCSSCDHRHVLSKYVKKKEEVIHKKIIRLKEFISCHYILQSPFSSSVSIFVIILSPSTFYLHLSFIILHDFEAMFMLLFSFFIMKITFKKPKWI